MSRKLSHLDARGRARMVDVGAKPVSERICVARGAVRMAPETLALIQADQLPKGDVLATARLAGIQAAKRTDESIRSVIPCLSMNCTWSSLPRRSPRGWSSRPARPPTPGPGWRWKRWWPSPPQD